MRAVVEQFRRYRFLHGVEVVELFIFDTIAARFPDTSLNYKGISLG